MTDSRPHRIHVVLCSVFKVLGSGSGGRTRGRGHDSLFPAPLWAALDARGPPEKGVQAARAALCPRFRATLPFERR